MFLPYAAEQRRLVFGQPQRDQIRAHFVGLQIPFERFAEEEKNPCTRARESTQGDTTNHLKTSRKETNDNEAYLGRCFPTPSHSPCAPQQTGTASSGFLPSGRGTPLWCSQTRMTERGANETWHLQPTPETHVDTANLQKLLRAERIEVENVGEQLRLGLGVRAEAKRRHAPSQPHTEAEERRRRGIGPSVGHA
jgi:hypothetical protein